MTHQKQSHDIAGSRDSTANSPIHNQEVDDVVDHGAANLTDNVSLTSVSLFDTVSELTRDQREISDRDTGVSQTVSQPDIVVTTAIINVTNSHAASAATNSTSVENRHSRRQYARRLERRQPKQEAEVVLLSASEDGASCELASFKNTSHPDIQVGNKRSTMECAVCLQPCIHPVELPCGHVFCFLCVKGVANQGKRCAMCRQEIPADYLDHPKLINEEDLDKNTAFDDGYQWFYEGRHGWWQYDERTSTELETSYKNGERLCELLVAGFLYVVDFDNMLQIRRNDPSRRRRIKRDMANIPKKGVAGLRLVDSEGTGDVDDDTGATALFRPPLHNKSPSPIPVPPTNTPQTPHTPSANSESSSPDASADRYLGQTLQSMSQLSVSDHVYTTLDSDEDQV